MNATKKEEKTLRVLVKNPGEEARVKEIPHTLKGLQDVVGGYIELVRTWDLELFGIDLYCNEEYLLREDLAPNFLAPWGPVFGPVFFCSSNGEGESVNLDQRQIRVARAWLNLRPQAL